MEIDFENEFLEKILDRGYGYYKNNLVRDVSFHDDYITAKVMGTKTYECYVQVEDGLLLESGCSCPYASEGNNCKHIAALLYYLNEENTCSNIDNSYSKEKNLYNIIKKIDRTELDKFLVKLLKNDKNIYDEFRLEFNDLFPNLTLAEYKKKVGDAIRSSAGRDGFIDYDEAWDYVREMNKITNEVNKIVDNGNYELAFDVVSYILDTIPDTEIDDSNGSTGEVASECIEIIYRVLDNILEKENSLSKKILGYILLELRTEYLLNYGIELYELLNVYVDNDVYINDIENGLVSVLKMSKSKEYFWNTEHYIDILIDIYNKKEEYQKIMDLLIEYSYNQNVFLKLVDEYIKNGDVNRAIELLKDRLEEENNRVYALKLVDIYYKEDMILEYKDILYKLLYELDKYDIDIYRKIKKLYSKGEWLVERNNIINKIESDTRYYRDIINIYIEEKMYDNIYLIVKDKDMDTIKNYEKYIIPKYNKQLINIYVDYCRSYARRASNRRDYRELASYLSHIKKMKNSKKEFKEIIEEIRNQYRNKPALQDELKGL